MKRTLIALIALAGALVAAIALADIRGTWTIEKSSRHDDRVQLNLSREHNNFGSTFLLSSFTGLSLADGASNFELRAEAGTVRFDGTFRDGDGAGHFTFTPNSAFVKTLRSMNVPGIDDVDDEKLLELALHGVSTDFIRSMRAEGYDVTLDKYVGMRIFNVTPAVVQELRTLGFDRLKYDDLIASRIHGVTPDFIRKMAALGYHHRGCHLEAAALDLVLRLAPRPDPDQHFGDVGGLFDGNAVDRNQVVALMDAAVCSGTAGFDVQGLDRAATLHPNNPVLGKPETILLLKVNEYGHTCGQGQDREDRGRELELEFLKHKGGP